MVVAPLKNMSRIRDKILSSEIENVPKKAET